MGKPTGFMEYSREVESHRPIDERIKDFQEIMLPLSPDEVRSQAARCMDCGVPFCHGYGCPVVNRIPEFNEYVYSGQWHEACKILHATNNFPEFTGRVCPAPCETACTANLCTDPVSIRHIEYTIVEYGFEQGWIKPILPERKTGKRVAVIGSGPAGLAAAQQLARAGHSVVVFEKDAAPGGLLRYGIPNFKLDKAVIDRRIAQMAGEGVEFETDTNVGKDITGKYLLKRFDAVCLAIGAETPRDLNVPGRGLDGVYFAMDFLGRQNKIICGEAVNDKEIISARGKNVVVIGGGDTGSDCVGTSNRQGAKSVTQFEILPKPPESRPPSTPWPMWPATMRSSSSHEEGCTRRWSVSTKRVLGTETRVRGLECVEVEWSKNRKGAWQMKEVPGSEFEIEAELVLLAMGFVHPKHAGLVDEFELETDRRGNIVIDRNGMTSREGVFAAGDSIMGASLVVRAIADGRKTAEGIDNRLLAE
ncbi:Glutamate synthase [NADPH] small chain [Limihaloglobus sulfuriphilus]|uniref:Glutamate synthase [NADPH] small chain n=1 Tax=Limihaloglobus sulfuriphilus TaxID=1851148 RepID=A0A1Q2MIW2_9BACT|nr:glutamate synthase subunit beta [Limihaloglobus sulfuriphilus]AQQ72267.1 Glutamate synthase [NADPH] small chain [Limihaloglobus sulfuriphilus]